MANLEKSTPKGEIFDWKILKRVFVFVKPYQGRFYFIIFLTVLLGMVAPIRPYLIKLTVDDYILQNDWEGLNLMLILLLSSAVMQVGVEFIHSYLSGWLGQNVVRDIRLQVYNHLMEMKLSFYDKTPIGRLVTRNISDIETLSNIFTQGIANILGDILQLIFIFAAMLYLDWRLTLVTLTVLPFLLVGTYIFKEKVKESFNDVRTAVSNLNSFVQEHVTGMAIVQIFNSEKREYKKFEAINKEHRRANIKTVLYYSLYFPLAEIVGAAGTGLVVWYGASSVLAERIELGTLIAFILFLAMFFRPIRMIADRFNTLQLGIVSSDRILKLLDDNSTIQHNGTFFAKNLKGNIRFEEVWFAYNMDISKEEYAENKNPEIKPEWVLKNISFDVKQGQTIAMVGATGAGKSSIINLLNKFYEIQKGEIFVDDKNIEEYDLSSLRQNIGIVLQDVFLFSGTIMDNITLRNADISLEKVKKAAELVGAKEFIEKLPNGFYYDVQERGATLSVGQRQLISFVRAMVYDPQILILDEATSSVDSETEELIQNAIDKMMEGRTAIVIAHRLATIQKADKIMVLDKGEIKESGSHEELLTLGGYYNTLYELQFLQAERG
ncbi:ABC-type multidrug transport system, ATPase and permease component [Bernardetia litoralis DSM 6794]|uniref:ABC-type multidrug transport system, ATPase and permease component n=1 Tax=Bernardetia litoralis (strain ATCC 23117 / DSM 6794 / NBRC 15988 / NCIMB 1366 / Fx l1 / Sio-4) TaxID=880071 RepID=I4AIN2_BERLS|nr:ABC transporter ATP-binding protein [Bernardetia litoralis]AFM03817.1 ABC-type multidrug transport system, ATPase and permease component [Bernardetia litoralis DSM 6794]